MRIKDMTWMQVEAYLRHDDRCVIPLGSTEQHAYLSLCVDAILAEKMAVDSANPLGVPVFPVLAYGITPYFMAYPGTVTMSQETYERVLVDIIGGLHQHGFRRFMVVNGHGGNAVARPAVEAWLAGAPGASRAPVAQLLWHDWWKAPKTMAAVKQIDEVASHASWMEGFPWTRVASVVVPEGHKAAVDLSDREDMTPDQLRDRLGDGSFGGYYERPDEEMHALWQIAVEETRELLEKGWAS